MEKSEDIFSINEHEVMEYYGFEGEFGKIKLKIKMLRSWILHKWAYSSPLSNVVINPGSIITAGVTIGKNAIVSIGSAVFEDIPDNCVVLGNPSRVVKKLDFKK